MSLSARLRHILSALGPRRAIWRTSAFRLAGFYMGVFFVVIGLGLAYVYWATIGVIDRQSQEEIAAESEALTSIYLASGLARLIVAIEDRSAPGIRTDNVYLLAGPTGQTLSGNLNAWPEQITRRPGQASFPILKRDGTELVPRLVRATVTRLPGSYRLLVGRDSEQQLRFRENFLQAVALVTAASVLLGIVTGIYASRRILRRVEKAALAGEAIAAGNLDSRLPLAGRGDEFDRLAGSLNATLDRIEDLMSGMRIATDSISHDVRRPLTRLRARVEMALEDAADGRDTMDVMGTALTEIDKTVLILDNLLKIARAEAGVAGHDRRVVDIATIAEEALDLYGPVAEDKGQIVTSALHEAPAEVSPPLVAQAIANLIDNAIKYTGSSGRIRVETGLDNGQAKVVVTDNGPGIPEDQRERATERFVRLDDDGSRATEGSGLGLSLVRAVAHLHGGKLELGDAGTGLSATIWLPVATHPARQPG